MSVFRCIDAVVNIAAVKQFVDLTVRDDHLAERSRADHGGTHHLLILYTAAVIRKRDCSRRKGFHVAQFPAVFIDRDGSIGKYVDDGFFPDEFQLFLHMLRRIRHRLQIGHRADCGKTAAGCRKRSGSDRFLIRKTRLSKMHMHIAETG